jgi:RimJ/RimL family protein N-acetyltransferase
MIDIRLFQPDEWALYKDVRLRALLTDPRSFGSSYEKNAALPDTEWRQRLEQANYAIFAVRDGDIVIGMTGAGRPDETPDIVRLWGSWLEPAYRGRGISQQMYQVRIDWARAQDGVRRVIVSHRAHNVASKAANQKHGFIYTHSDRLTWHDGTEEDDVFYALDL